MDYSYKFFFGDGYGKDFHIVNFKEETTAINEEQNKLYLTGCLLRFYQQCRLYKDNHGKYTPYLLDDPLMVFVGGSVTGARQNQQDTDVVTALKFFADFVADDATSIRRLDLLLRQRDELRDDHGLVFRNAFNFVRRLFPITEPESPSRLFLDILSVVFNSTGRGLLRAIHLKGSGSEIGLRVGDGDDFFGVINVGEPKKLWDMLEENHGGRIICSEQPFSVSLFDEIKEPGSKIRLLVGAKKFTEGWSCWRVSCMGLVNIGRNEGSQIIQLFGRGVRLKGLDFSLKRSGGITDAEHPEFVDELETLNVFGIRADYMKVFNEYIDEEDVTSERKIETITLPTIENLARTDLKIILPKRDMPDFKANERPVFGRYDQIRTKVSADWFGRLDSKTRRFDLHTDDELAMEPTFLKLANRKFLDVDRLYIELLRFKKQNAMYNLEISRASVTALLDQTDWYELFIPDHMLEFAGFGRVELWQEVASDLLKRYCRKYYDFKKDEFEGPYQEYRTIQQAIDDPEERFNKQFLQNLRVTYQAAIEKSRDVLIEDLQRIGERLLAGDLQEYQAGDLSIFNFGHHLYQPLIHVKKGVVGITVKPTHLNKHEKQFVEDMKIWCSAEQDGFLQGKEFYVLRNQSRGKGISFFDEGNFYPDFVLWLLDGDKQYISFADPHGLRHSDGPGDSKIQFHQRIKDIQDNRLQDDSVVLNSFIISPTRHRDLFRKFGGWDKSEFMNHHVLFMYDEPESYIQAMTGLMGL